MKIKYLILILVMGLSACKKQVSNSNDNTHPEVDVYVAGYEYSDAGIAIAKYWKNGQQRAITRGGFNSFANSIAVNNSYVYIAETSLGAAYWKGNKDYGDVGSGETGFFGGSSQQSGANSINVSGSVPGYLGDGVSVAGYDYNGNISIAKYWGPRGFFSLTDGTMQAMANSITVSGNDAYVAGFENNITGVSVAKYWKNEQAIVITDGTKNAKANSIFVIGSDVYIAGTENSVAKYWKNGQATTLAGGDSATSIAIVGSDVYVAGAGNNAAKYWKNGQAITLTGGASASSIAILDNNVYVAGYGYNGSVSVAKYWKNGVSIPLTNGTYNANATSIIVVKK